MRRLGAVLVAGLALAGTAQAGTIRVAVTSLGDPEVGWNLFRHAIPDLCQHARPAGARTWRLTCSDPRPLAAALGMPARVRGRTLVVTTPFAWRRFPLYLRYLAVRGTRRFPSVSAGPERIVASRPGLRLEFVRMDAHAAAAAFARGEVDVAPVPTGDLRAALADPQLRGDVRVRPLDAVDAVRFDLREGALAGRPELRRIYWRIADRADYALLASDGIGRPAFGLLPDVPQVPRNLSAARAALRTIVQPRVRVAGDPELASVVVSDWRDQSLGAVVAPRAPDRFERVVAAYPGLEGLFLALQPRPGPLLRAALAARNPLHFLRLLDAKLRDEAAVVPLAHVVGARLVSPRLRGWRQDALGLVDYAAVTRR